MKLRIRLLIAFLSVALLPVLILMATMGLLSYRSTGEQTIANLQAIAALKEAEIDTWLEELQSDLAVLDGPDLPRVLRGQAPKTGLRKTFLQYLGKTRHLDELFLLDLRGEVVLSTTPRFEGRFRGLQEYFELGKKQPGTLIQTIAHSSEDGVNNIVAVRPIRERGRVLGVLGGRASLRPLIEIMHERTGFTKTTETYLVGKNRVLLSKLRLAGYAPGTLYLQSHGVEAALKHRNGSGFYQDYRFTPVIGVYHWLPGLQAVLIAEQDQAEAFQRLWTFLTIGLLATLVALLLAVLSSLAITQGLAGRLSALAETARMISTGNLGLRAEVDREDEIGSLALAFNRMTERLQGMMQGLEREITERKQGEATIKRQRDLALALSSTSTLKEAMKQILDAALKIPGVDHGSIYLLDEKKETFDLASQRNLPPRFVEQVSHFSLASPRGRLYQEGKPYYARYPDFPGSKTDLAESMGLKIRAIAAIPIRYEEKTIAAFILSSASCDDFPQGSRILIESLSAQIGGVIARIKAEEALRQLNEELERRVRERTAQLETANEEKSRLQEAQIEALKQTDRLKDSFLSIISHELRTPLNAITGFGSLLLDEVSGPLNDQQRDFIAKILGGSDRMLGLIDNLLDMARMQAGRFEVNPEETAYPTLIRDTVGSLRPLIHEKGLTVETEIQVREPVRLDGSRIQQVLTNLLSNAIKFTPPGGKIRVRAFTEGGCLVTEVQDSGIGIHPADLPKLFTPFKQLDMSATRRFSGTGLGLSICRGIVEMHGGSIEARSPGPGKGSTFRFTIPLK